MCRDILMSIQAAEASLIVTPCPLCQVTLEMAQSQNRKGLGAVGTVPVLNLTQLIGIAMGFSERELGLQRALLKASHQRALAGQASQAA